ncbi:SAM-dependent methyltransferase [Polymorphospora rubra]|uniref:SAM-dependent methyltransferase n=1 Tax=Polymorphospora rubra TaxID=338584 RepID=UPI0033D5D2E5
MGTQSVPERLQWTVDRLELKPGDDVLEIGCGRGVAVALVADLLDGGTITAVDRSDKAIEGARQRNREHVDAGRVVLHTAALEDVDLGDAAFDVIFAVNVNLFWVRRADAEAALLKRLLRPGGRLHLVWEPPGGGKATQIADTVGGLLSDNGFEVNVGTGTTGTGAALVDVRGTVR